MTGAQIGPMAPDAETGEPRETDKIPMRATWAASDASGICGYSIRSVPAGDVPGPWSPWTAQRSVTTSVTDYDSQEGGGSLKFTGYDVRVRDCAGNITEDFVEFRPGVYQETGDSFGYGTLAVDYRGAWEVTTCACWSGATARKSSAPGARATFTLDYDRRHPVALVMENAPGRGRARVLVDGRLRATIDTYASTARHRTIVWAGNIPAGSHALTVENVGTARRPRIDVDAVIVSGLSA